MYRMRILIISCIWDNLGDIVFAIRIREALQSAGLPDIIFYYKDPKEWRENHVKFIKQNITGAHGPYRTAADVIRDHRRDIMNAEIILNTTAKYNQIFNKIKALGYKGQIYRVFEFSLGENETYKNDISIKDLCKNRVTYELDNTNNIFTGFGKGSLGIFIDEDIPPRTLPIWDREHYKYDAIYTCYLHTEEFARAFIEYILAVRGNKKVLLVAQGYDLLDMFAPLKMVRESSMGAIREWAPGLHIVSGMFQMHESNELFYYSEPVTATTGNLSMSTCLSYGKVIFLEWRVELTKTQCMFCDYLGIHGFKDLEPIFKYLINRIAEVEGAMGPEEINRYIEDHKERLAEFRDHLIKKHNLQRKLRQKLLAPPAPQEGAVTGGWIGAGQAWLNALVIIMFCAVAVIILLVLIRYLSHKEFIHGELLRKQAGPQSIRWHAQFIKSST